MRKVIIGLITVVALLLGIALHYSHQSSSVINHSQGIGDVTLRETAQKVTTRKTKLAEVNDHDTVPTSFRTSISAGGHLTTFNYHTKDYPKHRRVSKHAVVYLPNKYNAKSKYDILYLMHGADGNQNTWMGTVSQPTDFKNIVDHMIRARQMKPLIIVMPTITAGDNFYADTTPEFYKELTNDLMPAVEKKYATYAHSTTSQGFKNSRNHRGFAGFSMGGTTTWIVFAHDLPYFKYFLPMSGSLFSGPAQNIHKTPTSATQALIRSINKNKYSKSDFKIFAATGTRDLAYTDFRRQLVSMSKTQKFTFSKQKSFKQANTLFYLAPGHYHDYPQTYEYLYNGLPLLFKR